MKRVQPKVFMVGESKVHERGMFDYLEHIRSEASVLPT